MTIQQQSRLPSLAEETDGPARKGSPDHRRQPGPGGCAGGVARSSGCADCAGRARKRSAGEDRRAHPRRRRRGSGLIVHVSSDAAVAAYPRWGAYGVSKAALDHLNRIWAAELQQAGVRFLSVDPGEMDTAMHAQAMPEADRSQLAQPEAVAV